MDNRVMCINCGGYPYSCSLCFVECAICDSSGHITQEHEQYEKVI